MLTLLDVEGTVKVVRLSNAKSHPELSSKRDTEDVLQSAMLLNLKSVGVSVVDSTPQELLYVFIDQIQATYAVSSSQTSMQVSVHYFQVSTVD